MFNRCLLINLLNKLKKEQENCEASLMDDFGRLSPLEGVFPGQKSSLATFEEAVLLPICKNECPYEGEVAEGMCGCNYFIDLHDYLLLH